MRVTVSSWRLDLTDRCSQPRASVPRTTQGPWAHTPLLGNESRSLVLWHMPRSQHLAGRALSWHPPAVGSSEHMGTCANAPQLWLGEAVYKLGNGGTGLQLTLSYQL